ncbi:hypothetical protein [Helicobacter sp. 23-1045]
MGLSIQSLVIYDRICKVFAVTFLAFCVIGAFSVVFADEIGGGEKISKSTQIH